MENRDCVNIILNSLLSGEIEKSSSFIGSSRRIATWSLPFVNYAYQDSDSKKTVAILLRDDFLDNSDIKEKTIKALNVYDAVIDCYKVGLLQEADLFYKSLINDGLSDLPIGIVVYDYKGNTTVIQEFSIPKNKAIKRTNKEQKSYWCWWRDESQHEVATLLELSEKYSDQPGDIYTKYVYPEFFDMMINGDTKMWDGKPREKKYSISSYKAEKQNYKIPLCQLGLLEWDTGRITMKGKKLLEISTKFGTYSKEYLYSLAKIILLDGKHLDLIKDLDEFQKSQKEIIPNTSTEFLMLFDDYMIRKNSVGTRKPSAITTGAKKTYVRDEPKLWNKLGIIKMQSAARYYKPYYGIEFNWDKINEILLFSEYGGGNE